MVEPDNISALLERFLLIGGPIAAIVLAFIIGDTRQEITAYAVIGIAIVAGLWARFKYWIN